MRQCGHQRLSRGFLIEQIEPRLLFNIIYVDVRSPGPTLDGTSWTAAYRRLQDGIAAALPGDEIRVADGTYRPTVNLNRTVPFQLKTGVAILGGYAGFGAAIPDSRDITAFPTVLSGDIGSTNSITDNSYHVVDASGTAASAILDGVTIASGYANGSTTETSRGAGIYNIGGSPTIRNTTIRDCSAFGYIAAGAGVYNASSAKPTFTDCLFTNNLATGTVEGSDGLGGGIYNNTSPAILTRCTFLANRAASYLASGLGGGICNYASNPVITGCEFISNVAVGDGGGIFNSASFPVITGCTFRSNSATGTVTDYGGGGGIFNLNSKSSTEKVWIRECVFIANSASGNSGIGGAVCFSSSTGMLVNSVMSGNTARTRGGAAYCFLSNTVIANCTLVSNSAAVAGGAVAVANSTPTDIFNSIIWANTAPSSAQISVSGSTAYALHCTVQGGFSGTGNSSLDPKFIRSPAAGPDATFGTPDDDLGDLRLQISSPCIDSGDGSFLPTEVTLDLAGNSRIIDVPGIRDPDAIVDRGAYERTGPFADGEFVVDAMRPSLHVRFNLDVLVSSLAASDLVLFNRTTGQAIDCGANSVVTYNATSRTATWQFSILLPDGNYTSSLTAGSILATSGASMFSTVFKYDFFALGGDANRDTKVDIRDLHVLATNWNASGKVFSTGDFNYDGKVDAKDLGILSGNWQLSLPSIAPLSAPVSLPVRTAVRTPVRVSVLS